MVAPTSTDDLTLTLTPPGYISFQDYLQQYDGIHAEWHNGKVEEVMANNLTHQNILLFISAVLQLYLGYRPVVQLLLAGFNMYNGEVQRARQPDLMIVLNEHRDRILQTYLNGVADIAVEIVSPESVRRDYDTKFAEYASVGVREYWIIDPMRQVFDIHGLNAEGVYQRAAADAEGRVISGLLPDFRFDPRVLWQTPLPAGLALFQVVQAMVG
ncbi:MAG: Uma2 family endonuclease [Armatimonadetes bacterium]|nr:Uma2 family endonuclease [Anaerolineae bacterium]